MAQGPLAQLGGHLLGQRHVHVGDDDGRALLVQLLGDALAEALGRAGDNADLSGQTAHPGGTVVDIPLGDLLILAHVDAHGFIRSFIRR